MSDLALLRNVREFIDDSTFNIQSKARHDAITNAIDSAITASEKSVQISDNTKARRAEIMRLMREDFDPTPAGWEGREWNDNAEDVADRIEALFNDKYEWLCRELEDVRRGVATALQAAEAENDRLREEVNRLREILRLTQTYEKYASATLAKEVGE